MVRYALIASLTLTACEDELSRRTDEAAERVKKAQTLEPAQLAQAQEDFANLRALRVSSLRAEYSVAASQPLLIQAIANAKQLSPARRTRLDENLAIFNVRLAQTRDAIERLQDVPAAEWERRDDDVGRAMASLFIARSASWQVLDDKHRDERFPET